MIFYSESKQGGGGASLAPYHTWKAVDRYLEHYSNYLILQAIQSNPASFKEKQDATKELGLCERKLTFWRRHPNYDHALVTKGCEALKKAWKGAGK